jgi:hypothetical protein
MGTSTKDQLKTTCSKLLLKKNTFYLEKRRSFAIPHFHIRNEIKKEEFFHREGKLFFQRFSDTG